MTCRYSHRQMTFVVFSWREILPVVKHRQQRSSERFLRRQHTRLLGDILAAPKIGPPTDKKRTPTRQRLGNHTRTRILTDRPYDRNFRHPVKSRQQLSRLPSDEIDIRIFHVPSRAIVTHVKNANLRIAKLREEKTQTLVGVRIPIGNNDERRTS